MSVKEVLVASVRPLQENLVRALYEFGVSTIRTILGPDEEAELRNGVDALFLDVAFPYPAALSVLCQAQEACPSPPVIAFGNGGTAESGFRLAQAGVVAYWGAPFTQGQLQQCLSTNTQGAQRLRTVLRSLVGRMDIRQAQHCVREAMLDHALRANNGSRRSAAKVLGVTRPAVQRMLRQPDFEALSALGDGGSKKRAV